MEEGSVQGTLMQNRKQQVESGKWAVLWAEIKSSFNLAKPGLGSDAVVPSTNVKEIKLGYENYIKWGLALAQEWPEQEWPQVNARSRLSLLVLESWVSDGSQVAAAGLRRTEAGGSPAQRMPMVFTCGSAGLGGQESLVLLNVTAGPLWAEGCSFFLLYFFFSSLQNIIRFL